MRYLFFLILAVSCTRPVSQSLRVQNYFEQKAKAFGDTVAVLQKHIQKKNISAIQKTFAQARLAYKEMEYLLEYFSPYTARFINGAPVPEAEPEDDRIIEPHGLQVIEGFLFPYDSSQYKLLVEEINHLKSDVNRISLIASTTQMSNGQIWDAMRQEIYRLITLGISGYDVPALLQSIPEAEASLKALQNTYKLYCRSDRENALFEKAITYLHTHPDFITFDRYCFIRQFANPLSAMLLKKQLALGIPVFTEEKRAVDPSAPHLFAPRAIRTAFFSDGWDTVRHQLRINLGKKLFYDNILSGKNNRNCGTCHRPEKAFTDGLRVAASTAPTHAIMRNTPTLLNAALQPSLFYDQRVSYLEDQATAVIESKEEMHGSLHRAVAQLRQNKDYVSLFKAAFSKDSITSLQLRQALGDFIRSLAKLNSRFDKDMNGAGLLTVQEQQGFNLFMGKAKCATCHFMPLFNGALPPLFHQQDAEVLGVPQTKNGRTVDNDLGKYNHIPEDIYKFAFKTPTLRNAALTAPYMHNGVFSTLEEVMTFYNHGGTPGLKLENQTLAADSLHLTPQETEDVIAFIRTLNDE